MAQQNLLVLSVKNSSQIDKIKKIIKADEVSSKANKTTSIIGEANKDFALGAKLASEFGTDTTKQFVEMLAKDTEFLNSNLLGKTFREKLTNLVKRFKKEHALQKEIGKNLTLKEFTKNKLSEFAKNKNLGKNVGKVEVNNLNSQTKAELIRSKSSYEKLVKEHNKKLYDYIKNPDAHDNKGLLKKVSDEVRQKIISGRVEQLKKQIKKQQGELDKTKFLLGEGDK
ncbi:hypothetical protein ACFLYH_02885 [Candidatus Dependentiae bacterium]